jgi:RTA1 like protein
MIAPVFFTAILYFTVSRLVIDCGQNSLRLPIRLYPAIFLCSDMVAFVFQLAGGALAASADIAANTTSSTRVMVAGLSFQLISLMAFILFCVEIFWGRECHKERDTGTIWGLRETTRPSLDVKGNRVFFSGISLLPP